MIFLFKLQFALFYTGVLQLSSNQLNYFVGKANTPKNKNEHHLFLLYDYFIARLQVQYQVLKTTQPNFIAFSFFERENVSQCVESTIKSNIIFEVDRMLYRCIVFQCLPESEIDFFWMLMILLSVYFSKETPFAFVLGTPSSGKTDAIVNNFAHARHARTYTHIRAYARAFQQRCCFFCCHKCHTRCKFGWKNLLFLDNEEEKQSYFRGLILCMFGT